MKLKTLLIAATALASISVSAVADDYKVGQVMIADTWARVTLQSRPAAAYMKIHNMAETADKIVAASSPLADRVELHTHSMDDGVMRMRQVEEIALPAKGHTELKPGGLHLMIFGLKREVKKGEMLPLKLTFKEAGEVEIMAKVGNKAAGSDHSGHSHGQTQ